MLDPGPFSGSSICLVTSEYGPNECALQRMTYVSAPDPAAHGRKIKRLVVTKVAMQALGPGDGPAHDWNLVESGMVAIVPVGCAPLVIGWCCAISQRRGSSASSPGATRRDEA